MREWDAEEGAGDLIAKTLSTFLERFRDKLLSGRCEFVEGIGVVDKVPTSPPRERK